MEEQKREFTGIWIPKEIYLNKQINWNEKILLIEIGSLDNENGCFSSNKYFSEFLGVTERAVTGMIAKLKGLGYISQSSFDGRKRILHSNVKVCLSVQNRRSGQSGSNLPCTPEADFEQSNPFNNIYNKRESKETAPDKPAQRSSKFVAPSIDEVKAYCTERKNGVDPEQWYDHYQSNGWMVGKTHMKDWKAAVRTWERRDSSSSVTPKGNPWGRSGKL